MQPYFIEPQTIAGKYFLHREHCQMTADEQVPRADSLPVLGHFEDLGEAMRVGKRLFRAFPCPYCCFQDFRKSPAGGVAVSPVPASQD